MKYTKTELARMLKADLVDLVLTLQDENRELTLHAAEAKPTLKQRAATSFEAAKAMVSNASKACSFEERLALAKRKARETGTTLRLF